jgi:hypothetical protein
MVQILTDQHHHSGNAERHMHQVGPEQSGDRLAAERWGSCSDLSACTQHCQDVPGREGSGIAKRQDAQTSGGEEGDQPRLPGERIAGEP